MFDLQEFDSLKGYKARLNYASKFFKMLGHGSARCAFDMGDGKVLKVSRSEVGDAQNKAEVISEYDQYVIFTKIFSHDSDYGWVIMEKAEPMEEEVFEKRMKCQWTDIIDTLEYMDTGKGTEKFYDLCVYGTNPAFNKTATYTFFNNLIEWYEEEEPERAVWEDLDVEENWGWVVRGGKKLPVVIDYGATVEMMAKFY